MHFDPLFVKMTGKHNNKHPFYKLHIKHDNLVHVSSSWHSLGDFTNDLLLCLTITVIELEFTFAHDLKLTLLVNLSIIWN